MGDPILRKKAAKVEPEEIDDKFRQFIGLTADGSKLDKSTLRIEVDYTEAEYILEMLEVDQMAIETIEGK